MKPTILLVSDSAALDTGFGRVARTIGTALVQSGQYRVVQLGWFHQPGDRVVPFRVIPTLQAGQPHPHHPDQFGAMSFDRVAQQVKPDLVLALGDEWMVRHLVGRPRKHKLVGYVPIDSVPVQRSWMKTFRGFDQMVVFGEFGAQALRHHDMSFNPAIIPHGVDAATFRPLPAEERAAIRRRMYDGDEDRFVVGCVARNNTRKMLPRLLQAFRFFINPSTTCLQCGAVEVASPHLLAICPECQGTALVHGAAKQNARLYLHTVPHDPAGHDLTGLVERFGLEEFVRMPGDMHVGHGVADSCLNEAYNSFDLFTLPTGGEGFGLPILEAMAAGVPVLVTHYSGHVDFVKDGAGEFIHVSEYLTDDATNGERALVDLDDYVFKLDRACLAPEAFVAKWGVQLAQMDLSDREIHELEAGARWRAMVGPAGRRRAETYDWARIMPQWTQLFDTLLDRSDAEAEPVPPLTVEVL